MYTKDRAVAAIAVLAAALFAILLCARNVIVVVMVM